MDTFFEGIFWTGLLLMIGSGLVLVCHGIGLLWLWIRERIVEWMLGV